MRQRGFAMHPDFSCERRTGYRHADTPHLTDAGYRCEAVTDSIKAADLLEKNSTTWCCWIL